MQLLMKANVRCYPTSAMNKYEEEQEFTAKMNKSWSEVWKVLLLILFSAKYKIKKDVNRTIEESVFHQLYAIVTESLFYQEGWHWCWWVVVGGVWCWYVASAGRPWVLGCQAPAALHSCCICLAVDARHILIIIYVPHMKRNYQNMVTQQRWILQL